MHGIEKEGVVAFLTHIASSSGSTGALCDLVVDIVRYGLGAMVAVVVICCVLKTFVAMLIILQSTVVFVLCDAILSFMVMVMSIRVILKLDGLVCQALLFCWGW